MSSGDQNPPPTRRPSFPQTLGPITLAATAHLASRRSSLPSNTLRPRTDSLSSISSLASSTGNFDVDGAVMEVEDEDEGVRMKSVRERMERRLSIGRVPAGWGVGRAGYQFQRTRRQSITGPAPPTTMEANANQTRPPPPEPPQRRATIAEGKDKDPLQERMLKGEFYID